MSIDFTVRVELPETIIDHPEFEGRLETIMRYSNYSDIVLGNTVLAEFGDYDKAIIAEKALEALIIELDTKPIPMTNEEYKDSMGLVCPSCKGNRVHTTNVDYQINTLYHHATCLECGANWSKTFSLIGYTDLETKE